MDEISLDDEDVKQLEEVSEACKEGSEEEDGVVVEYGRSGSRVLVQLGEAKSKLGSGAQSMLMKLTKGVERKGEYGVLREEEEEEEDSLSFLQKGVDQSVQGEMSTADSSREEVRERKVKPEKEREKSEEPKEKERSEREDDPRVVDEMSLDGSPFKTLSTPQSHSHLPRKDEKLEEGEEDVDVASMGAALHGDGAELAQELSSISLEVVTNRDSGYLDKLPMRSSGSSVEMTRLQLASSGGLMEAVELGSDEEEEAGKRSVWRVRDPLNEVSVAFYSFCRLIWTEDRLLRVSLLSTNRLALSHFSHNLFCSSPSRQPSPSSSHSWACAWRCRVHVCSSSRNFTKK